MNTQTVKLSQVSVNEANPRIIKEDKYRKLIDSILSFPEMLSIRPVVVENTMTALGGNMRCRALYDIASMSEQELTERINGLKNKVDADKARLIAYWKTWQDNPTVIVIKADSLTQEQRKEFIIKDNVGYGEWDFDLLANGWDSELLGDWGVDIPGIGADNSGGQDDDKYTKKIEAPKYEMTGEKPEMSDLVNEDKYKSLLEEINDADITDDDKNFLRKAAARHLVFNYSNIAEYYAHASKEVQDLMEKSALVIIDFNKAVELGYCQLTKQITDQYEEEYGNEE
jgi:thiol-disulfide isomerase/thioredoxin